ncbi:MAG: bifunctional adenosylcobinamide kinase/adenosylcobinamide-phosphate guanylyltransferase [Steroidobacteraceae bacterium]
MTAIGKMLVLGGVRSGKSRHADELARPRAGAVTVIATGEARDAEMAARIEAHRSHRDARWRVIEEPVRLAAALQAAASPDGLVIVDCLTLWLSNLLEASDTEAAPRETRALLAALPALSGDCILISNEVGFGIIPASALARRFGDEAGVLHQRIAALCDRVILMVAGLPLTVKEP